jgi:hypothetical protein
VLEKINQKRARKAMPVLVNNAPLQTTSDNYTYTLRASRLEKNTENKDRIDKKFKKMCRLNGYKNGFIDYHIASVKCVKYSSSKFYFDKEDTETSTHLFVGKKPSKKEKEDGKFKAVPVKLYTYQELADILAKQFISDEGNFKILNNGYDKFGFSIAVEKRTLFRRKLPVIKAIIIVGGNRITW